MKRFFDVTLIIFLIALYGCSQSGIEKKLPDPDMVDAVKATVEAYEHDLNTFLSKTYFDCTYRNLDPKYIKHTHIIQIDLDKKTMFDVKSSDTSIIHSISRSNDKIQLKASNGAVKTDVTISDDGRFIMLGKGLGSGTDYQWAGWCK